MKVKPFYIRITDDMTPQMVQDAFDKCVDAGADAFERVSEAETNVSYERKVKFGAFSLFGVDRHEDTYFAKSPKAFSLTAKQITLDQLDAYLGVDEWKNGDECQYWYWEGKEWRDSVYVTHDNGFHVVRDTEDNGYTGVLNSAIRKPETQQQREERERLEAIETMCNEVDRLPHGEAFAAMATLYDLGYRKEK